MDDMTDENTHPADDTDDTAKGAQPGVKTSELTGHMVYDTAELRYIGTRRDTAAEARKDIPEGAERGRYTVRPV